MFHQLKSKGLLLAWAAMVVGSFVVAGCGTDEFEPEDVGARSTRPSPPAPTATPTPHPDAYVTPESEEVVMAEPEPPREVTYEEAEAAYVDRRYEQAVTLFTRYTDRKSGNPWGYYMLGLSAWKAGDNATAESAFEQALSLDSVHFKTHINLSRVLLDAGRPADALIRIDEALTIESESNVAYRLKGRAFYQLGQSDQAIAAYSDAIKLDDQDGWSMNNLGLILIEEERFDEALPALARAVELNGDVAVFFNNLGMALERTGHFRAAEEAYEAAVAIDGSHQKAVTNFDRIAAVLEDPGTEPLDLTALALRFVDTIAGWKDSGVAVEATEPTEAEIATGTTIEPITPSADSDATVGADSTESELDQ